MLAVLIREKYELPDRRGNSDYDAWKLHSKDILSRTSNWYLKKEADFDNYLEKLKNNSENYTVAFLSMNDTSNMKHYIENLSFFGIEVGELGDGYLYVINDGQIDYCLTELCWRYDDTFDNNRLSIMKEPKYEDESFSIAYSLSWNGTEYITNKQGMYFLVYDNYSKVLVDICYFIESGEHNKLMKVT